MNEETIGSVIVDVAYHVHREIGPGLLESVYEIVLAKRLEKAGLHVERQVNIPLTIDGIKFVTAFRADIIVENKVIIEVKSVEQNSPIHKKQTLTYLKLTNMKLGYVINFNTEMFKDGIFKVVNNL